MEKTINVFLALTEAILRGRATERPQRLDCKLGIPDSKKRKVGRGKESGADPTQPDLGGCVVPHGRAVRETPRGAQLEPEIKKKGDGSYRGDVRKGKCAVERERRKSRNSKRRRSREQVTGLQQ